MRVEVDSGRESRPLAPTVPPDIGSRVRRRKIVDAMAESVAEKTYARTRIADIVAKAHISRATFYKEFENKRACFDEAVEIFLEELRETAAASHSEADTPPEAIRKASAAVLEALAARPACAKLTLIEVPAIEPAVIDSYRRTVIDALRGQWEPDELPKDIGAETRAAFGRAQVLIGSQIAAGRGEHLPELLPDVVYTALLPFVGPEEALKQAQLAR